MSDCMVVGSSCIGSVKDNLSCLNGRSEDQRNRRIYTNLHITWIFIFLKYLGECECELLGE